MTSKSQHNCIKEQSFAEMLASYTWLKKDIEYMKKNQDETKDLIKWTNDKIDELSSFLFKTVADIQENYVKKEDHKESINSILKKQEEFDIFKNQQNIIMAKIAWWATVLATLISTLLNIFF